MNVTLILIGRYVIRYHQVILRNELDKNKAVCDPKEHRRLLRVAENELFMSQHPIPVAKCAYFCQLFYLN